MPRQVWLLSIAYSANFAHNAADHAAGSLACADLLYTSVALVSVRSMATMVSRISVKEIVSCSIDDQNRLWAISASL